jgi:TrmH family RNA methyltransferase
MLMGTSLQNSVELNKREYFKDKKAFYFGNEGHGLSDELLDIMDINYFIPINNVNSLNVGCAQAIILYEFSLNK